jgi:hypothetical protein
VIRPLARLWIAAGLLALAGCAWHRAGEADAVLHGETLPAPEPGLQLAEVLAFAGTRESGDFTVTTELRRISAVRGGIWEDVSAREVTRGRLVPDPGTDYVVVVRRACSDWEGRERWSDERASWFLLPGGRLAAYDHWSFGPRCAVGSRFRPLPADSPSRESERDLLRWLEQRHPPGPLPLELRFVRGRAYAEAGRLEEARSLLRFGDDGLQGREDLFEKRLVAPEDAAAFEAEGRRLRGLRADLRQAIRDAERDAAAP